MAMRREMDKCSHTVWVDWFRAFRVIRAVDGGTKALVHPTRTSRLAGWLLLASDRLTGTITRILLFFSYAICLKVLQRLVLLHRRRRRQLRRLHHWEHAGPHGTRLLNTTLLLDPVILMRPEIITLWQRAGLQPQPPAAVSVDLIMPTLISTVHRLSDSAACSKCTC